MFFPAAPIVMFFTIPGQSGRATPAGQGCLGVSKSDGSLLGRLVIERQGGRCRVKHHPARRLTTSQRGR